MYAYKILRFFHKIVSLKVSSSNSYTNDTVENVTEDAISELQYTYVAKFSAISLYLTILYVT